MCQVSDIYSFVTTFQTLVDLLELGYGLFGQMRQIVLETDQNNWSSNWSFK